MVTTGYPDTSQYIVYYDSTISLYLSQLSIDGRRGITELNSVCPVLLS